MLCKEERGELRGAGDALSCSDLCKPLKGKDTLRGYLV